MHFNNINYIYIYIYIYILYYIQTFGPFVGLDWLALVREKIFIQLYSNFDVFPATLVSAI